MSLALQLLQLMLLGLLLLGWLGPAAWMARDAEHRLRAPRRNVAAFAAGALLPAVAPLAWLLLRPHETLEEREERELTRRQLERLLEPEERCLVCRTEIEPDFVCCPRCQTELRSRCGECSRPVELTWAACPYCGQRTHEEAPILRLTA
jgi:hypothetical protein